MQGKNKRYIYIYILYLRAKHAVNKAPFRISSSDMQRFINIILKHKRLYCQCDTRNRGDAACLLC